MLRLMQLPQGVMRFMAHKRIHAITFDMGSYNGVEWAFAVSPGLSECSLDKHLQHRTRDNVLRRFGEALVRPRYCHQFRAVSSVG